MSGIRLSLKNTTDMPPEEWSAFVKDVMDQLRDATPVDTGNARSGWHKYNSDEDADISNDVDYASYLEHGHSGQAPNGIIQSIIGDLGDFVADYDLGDPRVITTGSRHKR